MTGAVVVARPNVMAACSHRITVVFSYAAHVDFVLTEFAFEAFT
jgi:hypothetical protein